MTAPETMTHFESLIDEHRSCQVDQDQDPPPRPQRSKLSQLVPTVGVFHTPLPLKRAFLFYDDKYKVTARRHVCMSFNEIRQILNLAQVMALCDRPGDGVAAPPGDFRGPRLVTFDGDQTLYSDGKNFESNPKLARALALLLQSGVTIAVVTAAGYEYDADKYTMRLTGLIKYFKDKGLTAEECEKFYMFGGECNYLLRLSGEFKLVPVRETGPGGWVTATKHISDSPGNWSGESITSLLDIAEGSLKESLADQGMQARVIRKKRAVGLIPVSREKAIPREALDECVLRVQAALHSKASDFGSLPYCAFNGGTDAWVDVGNKRVGVSVLQAYLGLPPEACLHVGDQFLNTGNDHAARSCSPCAWITSPLETAYILKRLLDFAGGIDVETTAVGGGQAPVSPASPKGSPAKRSVPPDFARRSSGADDLAMDPYTGELVSKKSRAS